MCAQQAAKTGRVARRARQPYREADVGIQCCHTVEGAWRLDSVSAVLPLKPGRRESTSRQRLSRLTNQNSLNDFWKFKMPYATCPRGLARATRSGPVFRFQVCSE